MKKITVILACLAFLLLPACSSTDNPTESENYESTTEITSTTETSAEEPVIQTTIADQTIPSSEVVIRPSDLNQKFDSEVFSINVSDQWEFSTNDFLSDKYIWIINDSCRIVVNCCPNKYFTDSFDSKPTNDDYINFLQTTYPSYGYQKYSTGQSIDFAYMESDHYSHLYKFYNYDQTVEISFSYGYKSDYYFSKESIDAVLNTVLLNETKFPKEETTEPPAETTTPKPTEAHGITFSGSGDTVTDAFTADGCIKVSAEYNGDSTFIVSLYDSEGNREEYSMFSNLGEYSGEKIFKFESGKKYMFEITARNGDWNITVE